MTRNNSTFEVQDIRLTVLGERGWTGAARLVRVSDGIATVQSARALENGAAIRVDCGNALILGECRVCRPAESEFEAQITLNQIIPSVTDLANLMASICEASPRTNSVQAVPVLVAA